MQRNKLIYALADASLVVSSDLNKGGTWTGAVEQLDKLKFVPVFIRSTGESSDGLDGLRRKGALAWPNPQDVDSFEDVFNVATRSPTASSQVGSTLFSNEEPTLADAKPAVPMTPYAARVPKTVSQPSAQVDVVSDLQTPVAALEESRLAMSGGVELVEEATKFYRTDSTPAEELFSAVRATIQRLLSASMKDAEVAAALDVSTAQAKVWLRRLVDEGVIEKKKPAGYIVKQSNLFE